MHGGVRGCKGPVLTETSYSMSSRNFFSRWLISLSVNIGQNIEKSTLCSERSSHTCGAGGEGGEVGGRWAAGGGKG